jgi:monovalent cation:H+ antiporter-2, CPA2 family
MSDYHPLIEIIVFSVVLASIFGYIAKRMKLPTILGYLLAGVMIGPYTPGFVGDLHLSAQLAEIGVILLMFGVGLHFSPKDLYKIRSIAIPGAIIQILSAIVLGTGIAMMCGYTLIQGITFSVPLSVASTVVLLRALEQRKLLTTQAGAISVAWLVVEDIVMVLAIVLLPVLANIALEDTDISAGDISLDIIWILIKISCFVGIMFVIGHNILPKMLMSVIRTKSRELISLVILAIALGFAYAAYKVFDASFALGAFLAGLMLNESEIGSKTVQQHLPLKDVFAVLFFVSVGMLFDPMVITKTPFMILAALGVVIIGKSLAAFAITKLYKQTMETSLIVAISLAQIGEFSFIFAGMARQLKLMPANLYDVILTCALISIAINPLLFKLARIWLKKNGLAKQMAPSA